MVADPGRVAPLQGGSRAVAWARAALERHPPAGHDLAAVRDAVVDLGAAHGPALDIWLDGEEQRLSALARDLDVRGAWSERLRRLRLRVTELADHGHPAGCLVAGVARVDGETLPVMVRPCRVRTVAAYDARLELGGPWRVDPVLATRLAARSPGAAAELAAVAVDEHGARGRPPGEVPESARRRLDRDLDRVVAVLATAGIDVERRLCLTPLTLTPDRAAADLGRVARWAAEHRVLDAVRLPSDAPPGGAASAADRDTGPDAEPDAAAAIEPGPEPPDAVVDAALDDLVAAPLDPHQLGVLRLVLAGRHVAVDAPPATGGSHVAAAVAALAAATGRRCLVLTPTATQGDVLEARLHPLGVLPRVVRGHDVVGDPPRDPGPEPRPAGAQRRAAAADRFAAARRSLDAVRDPWQVSRLDVLDALARLDRVPGGPAVEWPAREELRLPLESVHRVVDAVAEAVRLAALAPDDGGGPWAVAEIDDPAVAAEAASLAQSLAGRLGDAVRAAAADLAQLTGTTVATTRSGLGERLRLFAGLQATLDKLRPEVFDVPVDDLVAATGDRGFRASHGVELSSITRRRLVARARRLVRPGVDVAVPELHALLAAASRQRAEWQALSGGAGWAHVPPEVPQRLRAVREFLDACRRLGAVHPDVRAADAVADVVELARSLADTAGAVASLPERTRLRQVWVSRGLGDVVDGLIEALARPLPGEQPVADPAQAARSALWRAWWTTVARATNPLPGSGGSGVRAVEDYVAATDEHRRDAALRAAAAAGAVAAPVPVRVAVPVDLADLDDDERFDVVVLDDAGILPFAEVVAALARGVQVVALGDLTRAAPGSALAVLRTAPVATVRRPRLGLRHRPVPVPLAAGGGPDGPDEVAVADPAQALVFTRVPAATGLPAAGRDHVDTSDAEVRAVVELVLSVADRQWRRDPPESVAVVALTRPHAAAVAAGLRTALRGRPHLSPPFTAERAEPVVVVSADQARGLERDVVVLSVGFPRTPHGRVLHRFGPLDDHDGAAFVATAVTRARSTLHVVSGLRSGDLDPSRLHGAGARALSALLAGAELATGTGARPPGDPPAGPVGDPLAFPRRGGSADGSWVRRLVVSDLTERGLTVAAGPGGRGLTVTGATGDRVVVDLDAEFPDAAAAAARVARLAEGGWRHAVVAVEDVAALRTATAHALQALVSGRAAGAADPAPPSPRRSARIAPPAERDGDDSDVSDVGWGEQDDGDGDRLVAERPPHW
jgi:hypothetical protein